MFMPKTYQNLFSLIKAALTDSAVQLDEPLDYEALYLCGKKHQIMPLLLHGLHKTVGNFDARERFFEYSAQLVCHDQNQLYWLNMLQNIFSNHHIDYMLLKGASIKRLYPASELRLMGDIDILIRENQYPTIRKLLSQAGFREGRETDHELIWTTKSGLLIELHKKLIPSYDDDYYSYYQDPWERAVIGSGNRYFMRPEDEYVYLLTHLAKHYRDGGIGIKHLVDLWYFSLCYPEMDMTRVEAELDKLGLSVFHRKIQETIRVRFDGEAETELTEMITERIVESGTYGIKERWDDANATRLTSQSASAAAAKRRNLMKLIFLPYSKMTQKYPFLRRIPVLLPVMWIVRWIDAIVNKRGNIARQVERLRKIEETTVDSYTKELELVGLKFDTSHRK